jgi:hypothetical protein
VIDSASYTCTATPAVPEGTQLVLGSSRVYMVAPDGRVFWEEIYFDKMHAYTMYTHRLKHRKGVEEVALRIKQRMKGDTDESSIL